MQTSEQQARCNGIDINYQCFGDPSNPTMLLIMGLGAQMVLWPEPFCQTLAAKGYYVIRFDNRDMGNSTWLEGERHPSHWDLVKFNLMKVRLPHAYRLEDMAQDAFGLLDHLDIQRAHVVGVSMGGMIAQTMAIQDANRLLSMTSIMSTTGNRRLPTASSRFLMKLFKPMPPTPAKRQQQLLDSFQLLHGNKIPFDTEIMSELVRLTIARGINDKGFLRQLAAIVESGDRTRKLRQVQLPTLVLHGDVDELVPVECGKATAEAIPGAKLKIYAGMGHTLPAQLWNEIVDDVHQHASGQ